MVIVGNAPSPPVDAILASLEAAAEQDSNGVSTEVILTSGRLGPAAALNVGIRRAAGPVVIVLDPAMEPTGDLVTPMVDALADPTVAVAGASGSVTRDGRRFDPAPPGDVDVIDGSLMAFRRADVAERGPLDERFRTERFASIWWSLVLRDDGEGGRHRRAVSVPDLPVVRREPGDPAAPDDAPSDRDMKRDFYRYLDLFGSRRDLLGTAG